MKSKCNKNRKKKVQNISIIVIIIIAVLVILKSCSNDTTPITTEDNSSTEETKSLEFTPADEIQDSISIPATNGLTLISNQYNQTVDFYNPEENDCYFVISLYLSDDTLIYQSDLIEPSEHIQNINLLQKLEKGTYQNCRLLYDCYTYDESRTQLNSANIVLNITSQ